MYTKTAHATTKRERAFRLTTMAATAAARRDRVFLYPQTPT